jgi:hypothetical protein
MRIASHACSITGTSRSHAILREQPVASDGVAPCREPAPCEWRRHALPARETSQPQQPAPHPQQRSVLVSLALCCTSVVASESCTWGRNVMPRLCHVCDVAWQSPTSGTTQQQEFIMKKTIQPRKLQLSRTTLRLLSSSNLSEAHGGLVDTNTCRGCPVFTAFTCSCKHSVCDSCYNTDCCLMEP